MSCKKTSQLCWHPNFNSPGATPLKYYCKKEYHVKFQLKTNQSTQIEVVQQIYIYNYTSRTKAGDVRLPNKYISLKITLRRLWLQNLEEQEQGTVWEVELGQNGSVEEYIEAFELVSSQVQQLPGLPLWTSIGDYVSDSYFSSSILHSSHAIGKRQKKSWLNHTYTATKIGGRKIIGNKMVQ